MAEFIEYELPKSKPRDAKREYWIRNVLARVTSIIIVITLVEGVVLTWASIIYFRRLKEVDKILHSSCKNNASSTFLREYGHFCQFVETQRSIAALGILVGCMHSFISVSAFNTPPTPKTKLRKLYRNQEKMHMDMNFLGFFKRLLRYKVISEIVFILCSLPVLATAKQWGEVAAARMYNESNGNKLKRLIPAESNFISILLLITITFAVLFISAGVAGVFQLNNNRKLNAKRIEDEKIRMYRENTTNKTNSTNSTRR